MGANQMAKRIRCPGNWPSHAIKCERWKMKNIHIVDIDESTDNDCVIASHINHFNSPLRLHQKLFELISRTNWAMQTESAHPKKLVLHSLHGSWELLSALPPYHCHKAKRQLLRFSYISGKQTNHHYIVHIKTDQLANSQSDKTKWLHFWDKREGAKRRCSFFHFHLQLQLHSI